MNWTEILARAGIPESPGRVQAEREALALIARKREEAAAAREEKRLKGERKRKGRTSR